MNCLVCRGACCESFSTELTMQPPSADATRWIQLHAVRVEEDRLTFECRCTKLTSDGLCSIWEDRPMICELYVAGSRECLTTVKERRTVEQYQQIRGEDDPEML